jgi:hypothetical protein
MTTREVLESEYAKAVTGEPLRFKARIVLLGCHQHGYEGEADGLTKLLSGSKFSVSYEQMMNDPIVEESSQDMDMS